MHILSPNIYRNVNEALESFDYITTKGNILSLNFLRMTPVELIVPH